MLLSKVGSSLKHQLGKWLEQLTIFPEVAVESSKEENSRLKFSDDISLIAFLPQGPNRDLLERIARRNQWQLRLVDSWPQGVELLREYKTGVAVIDHHLLGSSWRLSLQAILGTPQHFSVLLASSDKTDLFWEEALQGGVYNVLNVPLEEAATIETVRFAWMFWKSCLARACGCC